MAVENNGLKKTRPNWDRYFLDMCEAVAARATCDRGKCGAVIVKDKRIMTTGYVGAPAGLPHCDEAGHDLRKMINENGEITQHCVRTLHAEQNAILQAARFGIPLEGATLYCKMTPCRTCAMMIINAGIKRVVCEKRYHADKDTIEMFRQAGIELTIVNDEFVKYDKQ
jgi:dCMP deaminase